MGEMGTKITKFDEIFKTSFYFTGQRRHVDILADWSRFTSSQEKIFIQEEKQFELL